MGTCLQVPDACSSQQTPSSIIKLDGHFAWDGKHELQAKLLPVRNGIRRAH